MDFSIYRVSRQKDVDFIAGVKIIWQDVSCQEFYQESHQDILHKFQTETLPQEEGLT